MSLLGWDSNPQPVGYSNTELDKVCQLVQVTQYMKQHHRNPTISDDAEITLGNNQPEYTIQIMATSPTVFILQIQCF